MTDHLARLLDEEDDRRNPELDEAIEETKRRIKEAFRDVGRRRPSQAHTQETGETDD